MSRTFIGLAISSGLEGVDVSIVRTEGIGTDVRVKPLRAARVGCTPALRDALQRMTASQRDAATERDLPRLLAETALHAIRSTTLPAGLSQRELFAFGFVEPAHRLGESAFPWSDVVERIAEQTGVSAVYGFRMRDRIAGGHGHPLTAVADAMLFRSPTERRILVHLGSVASILLLEPGAKNATLIGFDVGPGNAWLDDLCFHGSRGRESCDAGGKKAVQGRCCEPLLAHWLDHPHFSRRPPKSLHSEAFGRSFLLAAFETARSLELGLADLLCTGTHLIAQSIAKACRTMLANGIPPTRIYLSGGGTRNGFLRQLLAQQLNGHAIESLEALGVSPLNRTASAAALLAALACDGVPANLPHLTGASGSRLLGRFVPGDSRNWAQLTSWLAEQCPGSPRIARAA